MQSEGHSPEERKQRESKIAHLCEMIAGSNEQESELDKLVALSMRCGCCEGCSDWCG